MSHMPAVLGLHVPNVLKNIGDAVHADWLAPAGRLIISSVIVVVAVAVALMMCRRPKSPEPVTWAGAMLGATAVFLLMLVAYGVVPHEWITFANSYLQWDKTHYIVKGGVLDIGNAQIPPFDITASVAADIGVTVIYGIFVGVNLLLWSLWQKRPVATPEPAPEPERTETGTSAYGRPVTAS